MVFTTSGGVGVVGEGSVATEATLLIFALDWQWPATRRVLWGSGDMSLFSGRVVDSRVSKGTSRSHRL